MRYLIIVRHAKAEKLAPGGTDVERRLSGRGGRQCDQLRAWAIDESELGRFGPTTALVSASARTRETFERAFADTKFVSAHVESSLIYNGQRDVSSEDVISELAAIDEGSTSLLVVGHNPTLDNLAVTLIGHRPRWLREGFPTGAVCVVAIPDDRTVELTHYDEAAHFVPH